MALLAAAKGLSSRHARQLPAATIYAVAALVILRHAGYSVWTPIPSRWLPAIVWAIAGYSALGTLLNAASHSDLERAVMTPVALCLAVLCATAGAWGGDGPMAREPSSPWSRSG